MKLRLTIDLDNLPWNPAWPTQHRDMAVALDIIQRYQAASDDGLRLLDDWGQTDAESVWIKLPDWLRELAAHYQTLYGQQAPEVMSKVFAVLLPSDTLH